MPLNDRFHPAGALAEGPWRVVVGLDGPDRHHAGLRVAQLDGARPAALSLPAADLERVVVPLAGGFEVVSGQDRWTLAGRRSPFDGPTDVLYLGAGAPVRIEGAGRVAVAEAPTTRSLPACRVAARDVPVEIRGAGPATRQVHDLAVPGVLEADRLIVCEVLTPSGNWSSWPPHRHDRSSPQETRLEEVYYFETEPARDAAAPAGTVPPAGLFASYASDERPIETLAAVRSGDVALVPHGYHGPAAAPPGCDLYYLNVMAGPGPERAWRIVDDPAHAWVRDSWRGQRPDPRLPRRTEEDPRA